MPRPRSPFRWCFSLLVALVAAASLAYAQDQSSPPSHRLITQAIDARQTVTLAGSTRPEATAQNDRGPVAADLPLDHIFLQLRLPPDKEQELEKLIDELHDPASPNFHKWLTPPQYKERFSLAPEDIQAITAWLESGGFTIDAIHARTIEFSGTAGQVQGAFQTEIHNLDVNGAKHVANMSDPKIPAALAPAVVGIVSLNDFRPQPLHRMRSNYSPGNGYYPVVPADLATIYNFNPAFAASYTGQGQTVVVIEDSDVYSTVDWNTFRTTFGLATAYPNGSLSQVNPPSTGSSEDCSNPGANSDDFEAAIDVEWASTAAPNAEIVLASCSDTNVNSGIFIALQNILEDGLSNSYPIISISYGESEPYLGSAGNSYIESLYQQAVAEGISLFVAAGDGGAAASDFDSSYAQFGIAVSGLASTPYNVAVGGTDFGDSYEGTTSTYWNSTNSSTYESAKSYIPEIPWNDSCASQLITTYLLGSGATTYGSSGLCNNGDASYYGLINTAAGSGGPSGCASGTPANSGVVGGTCAGYAKPSWQSVFGNPSDNVRDLPDLSLFAANGLWSHYYVVCYSDPAGGGSCNGAPDGWSGAGGTSFGAPIMAGIQALINQKLGARQGNPDPIYYQLASAEYGASGSSSCNSSLGNAVASTCTFYDVTLGDNDVDCVGSNNCYLPSGTYGVLSNSSSTYGPAYKTTAGWDFSTGIGTVNVSNLLDQWPGILATSGTPQSAVIDTAFASPLIATLNDTNGNPLSGVVVTFTAPASGASGSFANGVNSATTNSSGAATSAAFTADGTPGTYTVTATASGVTGSAIFLLTNKPAPASITAFSGTPQSTPINAAFAAPLVALVADSNGNPIGGITVTFAAPASGASGSFAGGQTTAVTNASGLATSVTFTANGTIGSYIVMASVAGVSATSSFSLTNQQTPVTILSGPNFGTWNIGEIQVPLVAGGGNGAYSWSVISGSLPPGLALRTDNTSLSFPVNASAGLDGVATTPGTYSFTLQATSGGEACVQNATIQISALLVKDFYNLPDAFPNVDYFYQLTALNASGSVTWTTTGGSLPSGMTLSSSGLISGTPTSTGTYVLDFSTTDNNGTSYHGVSINVYAIRITTPGVLPNATQNATYTAAVTAVGGSGSYEFALSSGSLPNGLALSSSGVISGTVNAGPWKYSFGVTVTDTNQVSYTETMSIDIIGTPPTLPAILAYGPNYPADYLADCTVGINCGTGIGVYGGTAPFQWSATGLPPGMGIRSGSGVTSDYIAPGDAELWGTPTMSGAFQVQLTVTDATGATATDTFPLNVSLLFQDYADQLPNGTLDAPYSRMLRVIGGTGPYTVVQSGGPLPAGVSFNPANFLVSGTPEESGSFSDGLKFADSAGNSFQTTNYFTIAGPPGSTITISNSDALGTAPLGSPYSFTFSACCTSAYIWSVASGNLPPGLSLSTSGTLSGTPTTLGTFMFFIKASAQNNGANFAIRQFTLTVTPITISASSALPAGKIGSSYSTTLTASGGTGNLTWSLLLSNYLPPGLTLSSTGTISGTPSSTGQYIFSAQAMDTSEDTSIATFNISIYPANVQTAPGITLSPATLSFTAAAGGGNPASQVVTLSNSGINPLKWTAIASTTSGGNWLRVVPGSGINNGSMTASATISGLSIGTYNGTLQVTGTGAINSPQSIPAQLVITPAEFSFGPAKGGATSATLTTGQSAVYNLQLLPASGFTGTVTLACTGAPTGTSCISSPTSLSVTSSADVPFTVTVTGTPSSISWLRLRWPATKGGSGSGTAEILLLLAALMCAIAAQRIKARRPWALAALVVFTVFYAGCRGGSDSGSSSGNSNSTSGGSYTLTVTGTSSSGGSSSIQLTLVD